MDFLLTFIIVYMVDIKLFMLIVYTPYIYFSKTKIWLVLH